MKTEDIHFITHLKNNAKEIFLEEYNLLEATSDEVLRDAKIALNYKDEKDVEKQVELRLVSYY